VAKSSIPEGAIFEADLGNDEWGRAWALYDVSDILPVNPKGGYPDRPDGAEIIRVYNHHSGAKGKDGFAGLEASVKYSIRDKNRTKTIKSGPNKGDKREYVEKGWPGGPYTFWNCVKADKDAEGRRVIYRGNKDATRSYHTGKDANDHGVGLAWQGNLTTTKPSKDQLGGASVLFPYLHANHPLSDHKPFSWHAEAGEFGGKTKKTCPGPHVEEFVRDYRSRLTTVFFNETETVVPGPPLVAAAPVVPKQRRVGRYTGRSRHPLRRGKA
jgi:hypothetical protein